MVLNISFIVALKVALKPTPKSKSIKVLKSKVVIKSKPAEIIKYKDKITKLYIFYIYNIKALAIKNRRGAKSKSKLSKVIILISGRKSLFSNNTSIEDNDEDELIVI